MAPLPMEKITELETVTSKDKNELKAALTRLERAMPEMVSYQRQVAKLQRARFLSLVDEGFSPDQALRIVSQLGDFKT